MWPSPATTWESSAGSTPAGKRKDIIRQGHRVDADQGSDYGTRTLQLGQVSQGAGTSGTAEGDDPELAGHLIPNQQPTHTFITHIHPPPNVLFFSPNTQRA